MGLPAAGLTALVYGPARVSTHALLAANAVARASDTMYACCGISACSDTLPSTHQLVCVRSTNPSGLCKDWALGAPRGVPCITQSNSSTSYTVAWRQSSDTDFATLTWPLVGRVGTHICALSRSLSMPVYASLLVSTDGLPVTGGASRPALGSRVCVWPGSTVCESTSSTLSTFCAATPRLPIPDLM